MHGVLLIHGFAGSRDEVRPLCDFLTARGYPVLMPSLSGHEDTKGALSRATRFDWIDDVSAAYTRLAKTCDEITVIGFSMGGLLAVNLFEKYKFARLVTINTPIYYWDIRRIFYNLRDDFKTYSRKYVREGVNKPLRALWQFQRILTQSKSAFSHITCPTLVIQVQDDDTTHRRSGDYIYSHVCGEREIMRPKHGGHVILQSASAPEILKKIGEFLSL
ncbi:MAG: alpha/beta fold hydrolase [Clostridia bacterium]